MSDNIPAEKIWTKERERKFLRWPGYFSSVQVSFSSSEQQYEEEEEEEEEEAKWSEPYVFTTDDDETAADAECVGVSVAQPLPSPRGDACAQNRSPRRRLIRGGGGVV